MEARSGIVVRLRDIPEDLCWTEDKGAHRTVAVGAAAHEAADEIERLEHEVTQMTTARGIMEAEIERLQAVLRRIEKWFGEFPDSGIFYRNTDGTKTDEQMPYGVAFGGNGERDYMRQIARNALTIAPQEH